MNTGVTISTTPMINRYPVVLLDTQVMTEIVWLHILACPVIGFHISHPEVRVGVSTLTAARLPGADGHTSFQQVADTIMVRIARHPAATFTCDGDCDWCVTTQRVADTVIRNLEILAW